MGIEELNKKIIDKAIFKRVEESKDKITETFARLILPLLQYSSNFTLINRFTLEIEQNGNPYKYKLELCPNGNQIVLLIKHKDKSIKEIEYQGNSGEFIDLQDNNKVLKTISKYSNDYEEILIILLQEVFKEWIGE